MTSRDIKQTQIVNSAYTQYYITVASSWMMMPALQSYSVLRQYWIHNSI